MDDKPNPVSQVQSRQDNSVEQPVICGGFVICRPAPRLYRSNTTFGFTLMSDLHIGAPHVDYQRIQRDLKLAEENGDRVLFNGDMLDLILCKDMRRFAPDVLHPRLQGRPDIVNAAIDWAAELLGPYAHLIDMIGVGNHETAVEKYHNTDVTRMLIDRLQSGLPEKHKNHLIHYGGYTGFVDYRFRYNRANATRPEKSQRLVIYYHHGGGGDAPVTRGIIDLYRKSSWVEADVIWEGHKHTRLGLSSERYSCPMSGDQPRVSDVAQIRTGAYFKTYVGQSQESLRKHGRRSNWAADKGLTPQGIGGVRLTVTFVRMDNNVFHRELHIVQ